MQLAQIFLGITPKPFRDYLRALLEMARKTAETLIVPCCGLFTIPKIGIDAGFKAANIHASDISLFSSVIGYTASGRPISDLGIEIQEEALDFLKEYQGTPKEGGAILYALKWAQLNSGKYYMERLKTEMEQGREKYIDQLQNKINQYALALKGINYQAQDLWVDIEKFNQDPAAMIVINPPGYAGGYTKMFDTKGALEWNEPPAVEFNPREDFKKLYFALLEKPAFAVIYHHANADLLEKLEIQKIAAVVTHKKNHFLISNQPEKCRKVALFAKTAIGPSRFPLLFEGHTITPDSQIKFVKAKKTEVLYYRDLFAHKLGAVRAEQYYFGVLDGYIFAALGLNMRSIMQLDEPAVYETFGFAVPNKRYKRLVKLMMYCINSEEFKQQILKDHPMLNLRELKFMRTACLTKNPEHKIVRGIMKMVERIPEGNRFKLLYQSEFHPWTYKDCLMKWGKREGYL
ncbi:MAG: hypothetical protein ACLFUU_05925 [Desulfobacteraceae bacterium]